MAVLLFRIILGLLAAGVAMGTAALVIATAEDIGWAQAFRRGPLTVTAVVGLFGIVFIVVGAGAAVTWLIRRIVGRPGRDNA